MKSRQERIREAYLSKEMLSTDYSRKLISFMEQKLNEDAPADITSDAVIKGSAMVYGVIKAKAEGILAGLEEILKFYLRHKIKVKALKTDGDRLEESDIIAELYGSEKDFLKVERTGLNVLQRMSGVATNTKRVAEIAAGYGAFVVGTRKTLLSCIDKKAIWIGSGLPHRMGLYDAILIKDNHLAAIREEGIEHAIEEAISRAYAARPTYKLSFVEIEVSTKQDAIRAAKKYKELCEDTYAKKCASSATETPFVIMFDNMKPGEIKKTIKELKRLGLYDYALFEASGGINEKNLKQYAAAGTDVLSMGAITHSVKALDISQKIVRREK